MFYLRGRLGLKLKSVYGAGLPSSAKKEVAKYGSKPSPLLAVKAAIECTSRYWVFCGITDLSASSTWQPQDHPLPASSTGPLQTFSFHSAVCRR
jgi:hypothetical protein